MKSQKHVWVLTQPVQLNLFNMRKNTQVTRCSCLISPILSIILLDFSDLFIRSFKLINVNCPSPLLAEIVSNKSQPTAAYESSRK